MKIGGYSNLKSARSVAASGKPGTASAVSSANATEPPRQIDDAAVIAGIPAQELTPKVRDAIAGLMAEVDSLRQELQDARRRAGEAEKLADEDPLTPVSNRRAFVRDLSRMISYSERYGVTTSLIFFDINGMKQINDLHGHTAGDQALLNVADALNAHTRDSDVVGRLGGDEFAVVLAQLDETAAMAKGEELAQAIKSRPLDINGVQVPIEIAYGVFPFRAGEDASSALAEADRRMYERKRQMKSDAA
jgi:diguanylate cyclase (GGDEF)-like protein